MTDDGHLTGDRLKIKHHPGNPREYLGPVKENPEELFVHTTEDLGNLDHFLEFIIGNGQLICRLDALCSQHLTGRKTRGTMGVNDSDAWGAEAFPYYRCRPVGRLLNNLLISPEEIPLEPSSLSNYTQKAVLETGILETSFDWKAHNARGHTDITVFISQIDPHIMVLRFCDRVDVGLAKRSAMVETLVPYEHRSIKTFIGTSDPASPVNNASYSSDIDSAHWISYAFTSDVTNTNYIWYGKAVPSSNHKVKCRRLHNDRGNMEFVWDCAEGTETRMDIIYAIVSDRSADNPYKSAAKTISRISCKPIDQYQSRHRQRWSKTWNASTLKLTNKFWQKEFEIARYNLLVNTGGNWLGNIAMDEPSWDAHMLDSILCLNALLEWGHLDRVKKGYESLDRLYPAAVENAQLVGEYIGNTANSDAALLPTFLTHDGKVALYSINHFMLHSEQNAGHALGLMKMADYSNNTELRDTMVYRWLRAYANYAVLISEWDQEKNAYVFPLWKAGTIQEGEWWPFQFKESPLENLDTIADLFPESLRQKDMACPVDTVISHKWILRNAIARAKSLGRDHELVRRWQHIEENILIPRNEKVILRHEHDDGKTRGHIPPEIWGLFYPCEGIYKNFPPEIISATLEATFARRNPLVISWNSLFYALAFALTGEAETTWELLQEYLTAQDPRCIQAQDNVNTAGFVYYYNLNYAMLLLTLRNMLLQYQEDEVVLFPAVPAAWKEGVTFESLPIGEGMVVSAKLKGNYGEATFMDHQRNLRLKLTGSIKGFSIKMSQLLQFHGCTMEI